MPLCREEISEKLEILKLACDAGDDTLARDALRKVVPTFKDPEIVNEKAENAEEMRNQREFIMV